MLYSGLFSVSLRNFRMDLIVCVCLFVIHSIYDHFSLSYSIKISFTLRNLIWYVLNETFSFSSPKYSIQRQYVILFSNMKRTQYLSTVQASPISWHWEHMLKVFMNSRSACFPKVCYITPLCIVNHTCFSVQNSNWGDFLHKRSSLDTSSYLVDCSPHFCV